LVSKGIIKRDCGNVMNNSENPRRRAKYKGRKKYKRKKRIECDPITSYGLVAYTTHEGNNYFLLYQRRDNFEYMDFLRGVWSTEDILPSLFSSMSIDERKRIREFTFPELWEDLWVEHNSRIFRDGFVKAKRKYEGAKHAIPELLDSTISNIIEPPWGFPKGKKNNFRENPVDCALREFQEETRLSVDQVQIIRDRKPYIETFLGSNGKIYSTHYYLAHFPNLLLPRKFETPHCIRDETVSEEASNVKWFLYEEACSLLNSRRQDFLKDAANEIQRITLLI